MVTLAAIGAEARQLRLGTALITAIAWLLIGFGRVLYGTFAFAWLAVAWAFVCVRTGYREGKAADQAKRTAARQAAGLR